MSGGSWRTDTNVQVKNMAQFLRDWDTLRTMFGGEICTVTVDSYIDAGDKTPYVCVAAQDYESGPYPEGYAEPTVWWELLPPASWTNAQKEAHAAVHGYLSYWAEFYSKHEQTVDIVSFLQHHQVPDTVATIRGASIDDDGTPYAWCVAFSCDDLEEVHLRDTVEYAKRRLRARMERHKRSVAVKKPHHEMR